MRSKNAFCLIATIAFGMLSGCSKAQQPIQSSPGSATAKKILIVYLTRTKNTKAVAKMIYNSVGGDLIALELETPYPQNYKAIVDQVAKENAEGYLPPLKTKITGIAQYDTIFIGFPTWGMELPPPMKSFLSTYNLGGKTLIPFNTNAGYGLGSCIETVKKLCPKSTLLDEFSVKGGIERDGILFVMEGEKEKEVQNQVKEWLRKIGFLK